MQPRCRTRLIVDVAAVMGGLTALKQESPVEYWRLIQDQAGPSLAAWQHNSFHVYNSAAFCICWRCCCCAAYDAQPQPFCYETLLQS